MLATVCAAKHAMEGQSFFPLTVEYREKFYASGRIPGGYFKRENRPAEHETLVSRLIDRPCRPLFPEGYFCEVQLLVTVLSYDPDEPIEGHAITAASAALMASDIPWEGPIAGTLVGRIDGQFIADPDAEQREKSDLELLVACSQDAVLMIEGSAHEYSREDFLDAVQFGQEAVKHKLTLQENLAQSLSITKRDVELRLPDESLMQDLHSFSYDKMKEANLVSGKAEREAAIQKVEKEALEHFEAKLSAQDSLGANQVQKNLNDIKKELHNIEYMVVREEVFQNSKRADGRDLDEIRPIQVEIDTLPSSHGSAVFTRGQTQALAAVTLGTKME